MSVLRYVLPCFRIKRRAEDNQRTAQLTAVQAELQRLATFQTQTLEALTATGVFREVPVKQVGVDKASSDVNLVDVSAALAQPGLSGVRLQEQLWSLTRNAEGLRNTMRIARSLWVSDEERVVQALGLLHAVKLDNERAEEQLSGDWQRRFDSMRAELSDYRLQLFSDAKLELKLAMLPTEDKHEFSSGDRAREWLGLADAKFHSIADGLKSKYQRKIGILSRHAADEALSLASTQLKAGHDAIKKYISEDLTLSIPRFEPSEAFHGKLAEPSVREAVRTRQLRVKDSGWWNQKLNRINSNWGKKDASQIRSVYIIDLKSLRGHRETELLACLDEIAKQADDFVDEAMRSAFAGFYARVRQQFSDLAGSLSSARLHHEERVQGFADRKRLQCDLDHDLLMQLGDLASLRPYIEMTIVKELSDVR